MKRTTLNLHDEQADALQTRAAETGVLVSEQIRRAINLVLFADEPAAKYFWKPDVRVRVIPRDENPQRQPVLFTSKQETR
jgi:hypothetical protein